MLASGGVLLGATATTGVGQAFTNYAERSTYQVTGKTSAGSGSATVRVEVSNDELDWLEAATVTLALVAAEYSSDGFVLCAPWRFVRANVVAISGTGAFVIVNMGA